MLGNKCRGRCTGTALTCTGTPKLEFNSGPVPVQVRAVPVHPSWNLTVVNLYRYRRVLFVGIKKDYDSNARVRSSFNNQCGITMKKGIKA